MEEVNQDTYLGDILSSDGRNTANIKHRVSKGLGIVNQILSLLEAVNFGPQYFEIAMLMRESMLVNGILTNSETWYNLLKAEVKELEEVDRLFLRKILSVPESTPGEAFFLELGILPFNVIIKARRINYLHYLLSRDKTEMMSIFFFTQWANPTRGDWSEQVKIDLEEFEIPINFEEIKSKSKEAFKRKVQIKAKEYALKKLTEKQATHSKMEPLHYSEMKMQNYFKYKNI